jgi:hypothetical protein
MAKGKELQEIPGWSRGVRDNSAVRMLKMARPICPNSKIEMEKDTRGNYVPKDVGPDRMNCQLQGGEWWKACEEAGHNPYYRTYTWTTTEPVLEEDDKGRLVKVNDQYIYHTETLPNIAQVAISIRVNSGRGAENAIKKKGFKRLRDIGYFEVCQFRNCQNPVSPKAKSRKFGDFCSMNHLQLIAADAQGEMLHYPDSVINGPEHGRVVRQREKQLREAAVGAFEDA